MSGPQATSAFVLITTTLYLTRLFYGPVKKEAQSAGYALIATATTALLVATALALSAGAIHNAVMQFFFG